MNKYLKEGEWVYENIKHSWLNIVVYFDGEKPCNVELALYVSFQWFHVKGTGKIVNLVVLGRKGLRKSLQFDVIIWCGLW